MSRIQHGCAILCLHFLCCNLTAVVARVDIFPILFQIAAGGPNPIPHNYTFMHFIILFHEEEEEEVSGNLKEGQRRKSYLFQAS